MFTAACASNREAIYGVLGTTITPPNKCDVKNGTAFMIAPGVLATAAHFVHVANDPRRPTHQTLEAIRAPDIGQQMENASLIAEDKEVDIALLRIASPRSTACLTLMATQASPGADCGSLGFPLAIVTFH